MTWTDRYLAAVLRSIPPSKRADVERELRSSITDAIDERVGAGEDPTSAERAVLEDLGDPAQLAAGYTGQPTYLISPELFPLWRRFLTRLLVVAVPAAAVIIGGLELIGSGAPSPKAIGAAISGALNVAIQTAFWMTAFFVFLDWAAPARQARAEILAASGHWTLERLPKMPMGRISVGETAGEIVTVLITIGILVFTTTLSTSDASGAQVPLLAADFKAVWLPILVATLALRGIDHLRAYNAGRWTRPLAAYHGLVHLAFGVLVVTLALSGWIVNPAFGEAIGWPSLHGSGSPVMLALAIGTVLATGWEIVRILLRARRTEDGAPQLGPSTQSV
jgi:hypothetical protein